MVATRKGNLSSFCSGSSVKKRIHAIFSGRVQGVGFRYTAESKALALRVCGWVKNTADGDVELVAEQKEEVLKNFLAQLEKEFMGYIGDRKIQWGSATGEFKDFSTRF